MIDVSIKIIIEEGKSPKYAKVEIDYKIYKITLLPYNNHLDVNYGMYGPKGFFSNSLEITGEFNWETGKKRMILPLDKCIITENYVSKP